MPARPSRHAARESIALRQNGLFRRTIDTRQTSEITASAAATGSQISEAAVTARAGSAGQKFRKNEDIASRSPCHCAGASLIPESEQFPRQALCYDFGPQLGPVTVGQTIGTAHRLKFGLKIDHRHALGAQSGRKVAVGRRALDVPAVKFGPGFPERVVAWIDRTWRR